jgi:hypothetical protein
MERIEQQTFDIGTFWVRSHKFAFWGFSVFALFGLVVIAMGFSESTRDDATIISGVVCFLVFVGFAYASLRMNRVIDKSSITIDDDGLWPTHLNKDEALVRWSDVRAVRERQIWQRLELKSDTDQVLLKLEYQLDNFQRLRQILMRKMSVQHDDLVWPVTFSKALTFHVLNIVMLPVCAGAWLLMEGGQRVLFLFLCAFSTFALAKDYFGTVYRLRITHSEIEVRYPLRQLQLGRCQVTDVSMADESVQLAMHPEVQIVAHQVEKPIRLRQLGVDATRLYSLLAKWRGESRR